jgi:hypothetical protein
MRSTAQHALLILLGLLVASTTFAQTSNQPTSDDPSAFIHQMTTPVDVYFKDGVKSEGSGFFYQIFEPADLQKPGPQWRAIKGLYVVTNRHVVLPFAFENLEKLVFHLRRAGNNSVEWHPMEIPAQELGRRLYLHPRREVDVAVVDVLDLVSTAVMSRPGASDKEGKSDLYVCSAASQENFPKVSRLTISAGDDVLIVGYPRGFYDRFNKLPILKKGMLISSWGTRYENKDAFLVDMKSFKGSSGSIVISRPTNLLFENGKWYSNETKQFLLLGVYSGEPWLLKEQVVETDTAFIKEKILVDLGLVWYPYTIEEAISAPPLRSAP